MGSAAFLNEAINQLAEAYISRKEKETGEVIGYEDRFNELQKVKMYIADRNVYGIDLNPVAVELAEVSLWLNTIYEGGFVPWFGTQLVNGNSLIGARRQVYRIENAQSTSKGLRWYEMEPERVPLGKRGCRKSRFIIFCWAIRACAATPIRSLNLWSRITSRKWQSGTRNSPSRLTTMKSLLYCAFRPPLMTCGKRRLT